MSDSTWERYGPLGNVVFVALDLVVAVLGGESGSLLRTMVRSEGGVARLAVVALVGLALAGALPLPSASVSVAATLRIDDVGDDLLVFHTLAVVLLAASGFGVASAVTVVGFALGCVLILAVSYCMWSDLRVPAAAPAP